MQKALVFKLVAILALAVGLMVPLSMIEHQIAERSHRQRDVMQEVAASSAGPQRIAGPVVVVPWRECEPVKTWDEKRKTYDEDCRHHDRELRFFPEDLSIDADAGVEVRRRGIYQARLYATKARIKATYTLPRGLGIGADRSRVTLGQPFLALGLTDVRGLREIPVLRGAGTERRFRQGSGAHWMGPGIHAELDAVGLSDELRLELEVDLDLQGMESLQVVPLGGTTAMTLASVWPHPSFAGRFLPRSRTVGADGFKAEWKISSLATSAREQLAGGGRPGTPEADTFGVSFIEPVNVYLQAERAVKYGVLFVVLTFGAFLLLELLKRLPIHPVQYGLVGLALAVFFQLLISLSEHIAFWQAYAVSTAACIALLAFYLVHVLKSLLRGIGFAALLTGLYGMLYVLLLSEDTALLMGSLVLFGALALAMILTRRVDWYELTQKSLRPAGSVVAPQGRGD